MFELLDIVLPLRFAFLIPILNGLGYMLKHGIVRLPNFTIPYLVFVFASTMSSALGSVMSPFEGMAYWFDVAVRYGIVNGLQLTLITCGGYEAVRHIVFPSKRVEVSTMLKKKPFVQVLASFVVASAIFAIISICLGSGFFGAFCKLSDGWIFGILFFAVYDLIQRILKNKKSITKLYIVMQILLLLSVTSFAFASMTAVFSHAVLGLAIAMVVGIVDGLLPVIIGFFRNRKLGRELSSKLKVEANLQEEWEEVRTTLSGLSADEKAKKLEDTLAFRLKNDSIIEPLDFERAMVTVTNENGVCAATVTMATQVGADAASIEEAKTYIAGLV